MKPIPILRLLALIFCIGAATPAQAQFKYIGLEGRITGGSQDLSHCAIAVQYLNQFSAHHAYGLELSLPALFDRDVTYAMPFTQDPFYSTDITWTRKMSPTLGARYRLFVGNSFFVGTGLQLGLIREFFLADRYSKPTSDALAPWVPAVYLKYTPQNPILRMQFETGWMWTMGKFLYGSLHSHLGFQKTFAKTKSYGTIQMSPSEALEYRPLQGLNVLGGAALGLGAKF